MWLQPTEGVRRGRATPGNSAGDFSPLGDGTGDFRGRLWNGVGDDSDGDKGDEEPPSEGAAGSASSSDDSGTDDNNTGRAPP